MTTEALPQSSQSLRGNLYEEVKDALERLERLRPFFDYLDNEKRLLAELLLAKKDALLREAKKLEAMGVPV